MSKGGLIIRLIDVVLILLLGFIGISDFTIKTQIKLPQGADDGSSAAEKIQVIHVRVNKDGLFEIDDGARTKTQTREIQQVEQQIQQLYERYSKIIIIIEPHLDTIIQTTVDLVDICEKYQIPKTINYEL